MRLAPAVLLFVPFLGCASPAALQPNLAPNPCPASLSRPEVDGSVDQFVFCPGVPITALLSASEGESVIYLEPGEPMHITFPDDIVRGKRRAASPLRLERDKNDLYVCAGSLPPEGEGLEVFTDEKVYRLRFQARSTQPAVQGVLIIDQRLPLRPSRTTNLSSSL